MRIYKNPEVVIHRRHKQDCPVSDSASMRCSCPIFYRYSQLGQQFRGSMETRIWADAEVQRVEMQERLRAGESAKPEPTPESGSVDNAIKEYLADRRASNISSRYQTALGDQLVAFAEAFGDRPVSSLTVSELRRWRANLTWEPNTLRVRQVTMRGFLRFVQRPELADVFKKVNVPDPEPMPFSDDELQRLVAEADPLVSLFVRAGATLGASCVDLVVLRRETLESTDPSGIMRYLRKKTGREALPTISAALKSELLSKVNANGFIFWSGVGDPHHKVNQWIVRLRNLYKQCGLYSDGQVCHRLRDTAVQYWFDCGRSVSEVARMAGDNPTTIERHYRAAASKAERDRIAAVPARF